MGTQILTGSTGRYETHALVGKNLTEEYVFVVSHDTCLDSEKIPVRFNGSIESVYILMKHAKFIDRKTKDY